MSLSSPNLMCIGWHVHSPANFNLDQLVSWGPSDLGAEGLCWHLGSCANVGCLWECCVFAGSTKMEQSVSGAPVGCVREMGSGKGYQGQRADCVSTQGIHTHVCL